MPVVRRPDRVVDIAPLRGGQKSAAETPASMGAGVQQAKADTAQAAAGFFGHVAQESIGLFRQMQAEAREKANRVAALASSNGLSDWQADLYDPDHGLMLRKGLDAQGIPEEARASFDKAAGAIETTLTTPEQKDAFARQKQQVWHNAQLDIFRHVSNEQDKYAGDELTALINNKSNEAIQHSADPKQVAVSLQTAVSALQTTGKSLGMGPEEIATKTLAIQTKVHTGVISTLLAQDQDQQAAAYFAATKGQIDGDKQDGIIRALDEGTLRGQSQKAADEILRTAETPKAAREAAKAIDDPKLRDMVEQRIEHAQAVAEREETQAERDSMKTGYDILDQTGDVAKIPPLVWSNYSGATRSAMRSYALQRARGVPIETDIPTYYALIQRAGDEPEKFVAENLLKYRGKLDDAEFKQLASLQLSLKNGDKKAAAHELAPYNLDVQVVNDTLAAYGIDPKPKDGTPEAAAIANLRNIVRKAGDASQALTGKPATNADVQAEVDRILSVSVKVPGSWWNLFPGGQTVSDREVRVFDATVRDIPPADRAQIEAALKARGRPVTDGTVLDLYRETKLRKPRK